MNESPNESNSEDETLSSASDGSSAKIPETDAACEQQKPKTKKQLFLQLLIFTAFMASAGVIQFVTTGLLSTWTGWIPYWLAYLIGLVLSVVWSFTFNRKFTFRSASNVTLAMILVLIYYCAFTPLSTFGADAILDAWRTAAGSDWTDDYELVITAAMMLINFVTEFLWEKFVVFNDNVMARLERRLHMKKRNDRIQTEESNGTAPEDLRTEDSLNENDDKTE